MLSQGHQRPRLEMGKVVWRRREGCLMTTSELAQLEHNTERHLNDTPFFILTNNTD